MKRLLVYCEGPTEESFIKAVLAPYLQNKNINALPVGAGGVSKYSIIKKELTRLCKTDSQAIVTTMLDYYGLPGNTPGIGTTSGSPFDKARHIESSVEDDIGKLPNLLFNLVVHEFEGLLFANTEAFANFADTKQLAALAKIKSNFDTPEHINNSYDTSPSRRIVSIIPNYAKVRDGTVIAKRIGIDGISAECKHFAAWMSKIISLATHPS